MSEEQRREAGCSAGRMPSDFHHGLLGVGLSEGRGQKSGGALTSAFCPDAHVSARPTRYLILTTLPSRLTRSSNLSVAV